MEIKAALDAVASLDGPLLIVSDSTYVVNCFRDRWYVGWIERGWLNKAKKAGGEPGPLEAAGGGRDRAR
jgi:ribonuclease HI